LQVLEYNARETSAKAVIERPRRAAIIAFFGSLVVIDWALYFRHAGHFFQGDAIFLLNHRGTSLLGYLREFVVLNPSGWYRPLANELLESILYPFAGLHPIPYRIPVYALFLAITFCVYRLTLDLTRRHLAAGLATFFFTVHTANAYTTYDIAFMPELLFAFFYITATMAFFRYLQSRSRRAYWLSILFFVAGLLSKEPAVTLPGILFLVAIAFDPVSRPPRERFLYAIRTTIPHAVVLIAYLAYAVGYLDVAGVSVRGLIDQSQKPSVGDYTPVINGGVLTDARLAISWGFNIPRGWWGQWQHLSPALFAYLHFFQLLTLALIAVTLIRPERKIILFGLAWFWIALLPALPIATHFVPNYLFVPIVGLSIVVGVVFYRAYDALRSIQPLFAAASLVVVFTGLLYVNSRSIRGDIRDNRILGGSAKLASDTLADLKRLYPTFPAKTTFYFADADESLQWEHDNGGLVRMAYGDENIKAIYASQGVSLPSAGDVTVFDIRKGHLFPRAGQHSP
jgi:hypothetical protein